MGRWGGSRGKMRRMRAGPVVPVGLAWRWGRDSRHKLAKSLEVEGSTVLIRSRTRPSPHIPVIEPVLGNKRDWIPTAHYCGVRAHKKSHFTGQMTRKWLSMTQLTIKERCHVKKDTEIRLYLQERKKGMTQRVAAARAGIGERTARTYERAGALPSQRKRLHDWKTRNDPFEEDWSWVVSQLERDPALQGSILFALLCERHPDRY